MTTVTAKNVAYTLHADGRTSFHEGAVSLKAAQQAVGGYVQMLELPDGTQLLCNEEGKLRALPLNAAATTLVQGLGLLPGDYIAGDAVVLCGVRRWR